MFGLSKVNNSVVIDGLSNTIETPHACIKSINYAFADNNGIYCVKPFHHPRPGIRTVVTSTSTASY